MRRGWGSSLRMQCRADAKMRELDWDVDEVEVFPGIRKGDLEPEGEMDQGVLDVDPSLCSVDAAVVGQDVE